jgi:hypothetical protein
MIITNCGCAKEEWQVVNLCSFQKKIVVTKKDPYLLPFTNEVLNIVAKYEAYSFLDGFSRYHQISITCED